MVCNPSCFHLLRQIQHHFSKCLYSCTARPLFRTFLQLNFIQRSRDRNFLCKIVSVYPRARQPTASVVATSVCAATRLRLRYRDRDSAIIHQNMHTGCFLISQCKKVELGLLKLVGVLQHRTPGPLRYCVQILMNAIIATHRVLQMQGTKGLHSYQLRTLINSH